MLVKIKLAAALVATVAGGGAVAANHAVLFGGSGAAAPQVSVQQETAATVDPNVTVPSAPVATTPTVPQVSLPAAAPSIHGSADASVSANGSTSASTDPAGASADVSASASASASVSIDPAGARLALDTVKGLQTQCPSLISALSGATKELTAVPTTTSGVFEVTGTAEGTAKAHAALLVDVSAHTVTSSDAVTAAALSACTTLAQAQPSAVGGPVSIGLGPATLTIGG